MLDLFDECNEGVGCWVHSLDPLVQPPLVEWVGLVEILPCYVQPGYPVCLDWQCCVCCGELANGRGVNPRVVCYGHGMPGVLGTPVTCNVVEMEVCQGRHRC